MQNMPKICTICKLEEYADVQYKKTYEKYVKYAVYVNHFPISKIFANYGPGTLMLEAHCPEPGARNCSAGAAMRCPTTEALERRLLRRECAMQVEKGALFNAGVILYTQRRVRMYHDACACPPAACVL